MVIKEAITKLVDGESLERAEAAKVMEELMEGEATPAQFAAFATALRMKGETVEEMTGLASVMRAHALHVPTSLPVIDTCGTGGDASGTFNISTTAAFVVAAAGVPVAKHGNRAASSRCGSADVLEALGVAIDLNPDEVASCIDRAGVGFMFAPAFHPAMRHVAAARREIGIRTVFNLLGPLTNPARAQLQLLGVADGAAQGKMAEVLSRLGCRRALVVRGDDGLDELTLCARSKVYDVSSDGIREYFVEPEEVGLRSTDRGTLLGGTAADNAATLRDVLSGSAGPRRDVVLLNAAGALVTAGKTLDLAEGVAAAAAVVDSGAAKERLDALVAHSQKIREARV